MEIILLDRAVKKGHNPWQPLWLSMLDGPLLRVNFPVVDTIHQKGNKFVMRVKIKATSDSKLNYSPIQGFK